MSRDDGGPLGVVVLGSTGSIGVNTLDVLRAFSDRFRVVGLAAGSPTPVLDQQVREHQPAVVVTRDTPGHYANTTELHGSAGLMYLATMDTADIVVIATTGHTAIEPTLAALDARKIVALANKETIVAAGELVMAAARRAPGCLRPVDSEHCAIWQCVGEIGVQPPNLRRLVLTASGGPFRGKQRSELEHVTAAAALRHPNWNMGAKITIDSATMMNKGLELIEASWLFAVPPAQIDVVVHPQSIVHSLVEYDDGSLIAQLGPHDMRLPIQYALTWPERWDGPANRVDILTLGRLDFGAHDDETFPAIAIARSAVLAGATYPAVLSAADDVAVDAFLRGQIRFLDVIDVVERVLDAHRPVSAPLTIESIRAADDWARSTATSVVGSLSD